jgi:tRNA nucleotidyltransferase (CCA-adding enzyme)
MKPAAKMRLLEDADLLRRPEGLVDFARACEADYRGRGGFEDRPYPQAAILAEALDAARSVRARDIDTEGLKGSQVGRRLREARIEAIADTAGRAG